MSFNRFFVSLAFFVPGIALAHVGVDAGTHHGSAFVEGFAHPFTGLDHITAMVAVGFWSALTMRRVWVAPAAFVALLMLGATMGVAATAISVVEPVIIASVLALGLLIVARIKLPVFGGALLIGAFAVFHGVAHGRELSSHAITAVSGMALGTSSLHVLGVWFGNLVRKQNIWIPRAVGAVLVLFGMGMLGSTI
jgi:urease accessory protein